MKVRPLIATLGATLLVTLVAVNANAAPCYYYGSRDVPVGAVAGGARFATVVDYQPVGKSSKASVEVCSTGVPWRLKNGTRGFLTAGHCLPAYERARAQIFASPTRSGPWVPGAPLGLRPRGMTTFDAFGTIPGMVGDIAFVPSKLPVGNYVFTGPAGSRSLMPITSWTSKATSTYTLCFSGFRSGGHCGLKQDKKTSYRWGTRTITRIAEATYGPGSPSQTCGDSGDSGGVVYRMAPNGRSAYVVGVMSGMSGSKISRWTGCSMYYTPLEAAVKQFGGGPITS